MIDKKILSLVLNYKELYEDFCKYDILLNDDCRKLKKIVDTVYKKNGSYNKDLIINHIEQYKDFDTGLFYDIYDSELDETKYQGFLNEMITRKLKMRLFSYATRTQKDKDKNHIDIKEDVTKIINDIENPYIENIDDMKEGCKRAIENLRNKEPVKKVHSGFWFFDKWHRGYGLTNWVILAAQESVGKTSKILSLMINQLSHGVKIGFISCEMEKKEIEPLFYCSKANISFEDYENNSFDKVDQQKYIDAVAWFYEQPLYIVDTTSEWTDIKRAINYLKIEKGIDIIYIDHLHHIRSKDHKEEYQRLDYISKQIKDNAKKMELVHFTIAILNDEGKSVDIEKLQPRHIKGNKDIGYDCDVCVMMGVREWAVNGDHTIRKIEYFIRKNRNGRLGWMADYFDCPRRNFKELTRIE